MIYIKILQAFHGRIVWKHLKQKYNKKNGPSHFIFFPSKTIECNAWAIAMLHMFLEKYQLYNIVILAYDEKIFDALKYVSIENVSYCYISEKKMDDLMKYYALIDRSREWTVVSVKEPYDTGAENLLGKKGITYKEIVYYDIFKFTSSQIDNTQVINETKLSYVKKILESSEEYCYADIVHER